MRVLVIPKPEPVGSVTSGIGRYVGILVRHLGPDVEIVHLPGAPHAEDQPRVPDPKAPVHHGSWRQRLRSVIPPTVRLAVGYARDTCRMAALMSPFRSQVDVVHINRVGCEIQTIAARLAGFRHVVTTIHNLPGEDAAAGQWFRRLVERLSFACAGRLISVSEATYEAWRDRIGLRHDRVTVIHNGIDPVEGAASERQAARRSFGLSDDALVFGICARLHPMKGHPVLLQAFARLKNDCPAARLLIAGDGPEEAAVQQLVRQLGLSEFVQLLGYVRDPQPFLAAIDVSVLPSVTLESLPFTVVEAMAAAVPSIVSDVGGAKEIVGASGGGCVVPKGDVEALAAAMRAYASDAVRRREEGHRSAAYAREFLTGEMMAQATLAVYRRA